MSKMSRLLNEVTLALEQDVPEFRVVKRMHAAHPEISLSKWEKIVADARDALDAEREDVYDEYPDPDDYVLHFQPRAEI